ncbi:hypothetical protein GCM10008905_06690 [Clostridium malenominatum]|uniref:Polymerase beta nucleotidyltransferase domain-containing protein n=1 Tax=Clostridium malenominatum TaxID=1539 RepID=A0ABP3TW14_9CLOT
MELYERIEHFKDEIVKVFSSRVECILLTGSVAREEIREKSDIDIWVFLDEIKFEDLYKVSEVVKNFPKEPKINPQVTTFKECLLPNFTREYSPIQYNTDGKVLYGKLKVPYPKREEFLESSKNLAAYIIMGIRHFITIDENEKSLLSKKLLKRILKPLTWALRYKYAGIKGKYILDLEKLKDEASEEEIYVIDIFQNLLLGNYDIYEGKVSIILEKTYNLCKNLMYSEY